MLAIRTEDLTKVFRNRGGPNEIRAVDRLSLEVPEGRAFAFLGPNGAGKTTTIYMLLGLRRPTSGRGEVFGMPLGSVAASRRIGFLPEDMRPKEYHTVEGMLSYCAQLYDMSQSAAAARIDYVLSAAQLQEARRRRTSQLSKGMVQRLGIAQALLSDPDLLILDEPTSNLDPVGRRDVMNLLTDLRRQGKTIFISSHVLSEVESVCDDVAILNRGRLVRQGPLSDLASLETGYEITTRGLGPAAADQIAQFGAGIDARPDGTTVIKVADEDAQQRVLAILLQARHPVLEARKRGATLEQVFFEALREVQQ
jgi:ABC-2 type transport system ATP-binding protein